MDPNHRVLSCDGVEVPLSPTLFEALLYLIEHAGRVVSKEELLDAVWPDRVVADANVSQTIFTLRKALAEAGAVESLIVTAPRRGYRFTGAVSVHSHIAGEPARLHCDDLPGAGSSPPGRRRRPVVLIIGAVCALALVAAGALFATHPWRRSPAPVSRLMVLSDLENLTRDPVFDKTLTMATRIDLRKSPSLSVLSEAKTRDTLELMTRARDTPLTPALAREVCSRANGQGFISGAVAQIGAHYLLTLVADDCVDGQERFAEKAEIATRDDILPTLDRLVDHMRGRLDGDRIPIEAFGFPLLPRRTVSLDALKAYSEAHALASRGRRLESVPLFQQAIALDPKFAMAYRDLAVVQDNLNDEAAAQAAARQAYALRDLAGDYDRSLIDEAYGLIVTHDQEALILAARARTTLHPNDPAAWGNLSDRENWVGRYDLAIADGRRELALQTDIENPYVVVARALLHAGLFDQAAAVCAQGVSRHVDGDDLHGLLYQIAYARRDEAGMARELQWARANAAEGHLLLVAMQASFSRGKVRQALEEAARAAVIRKITSANDYLAAPNARILHDLGFAQMAKDSLGRRPPGEPSADGLFATAEMGDPALASSLIAAQLRAHPADTLLNASVAPQAQAALALRQGKPLDAIADLRIAAPYERVNQEIPYLRGRAYLALLDGSRAALEFHKILDHPGPDILSQDYPLARLGLARALTLEHDTPAARGAYRQFLSDWNDADPDVPVLIQAKAEYAALPR